MKNILTVDVEEWYCDLKPSEWGKHEDRVVEATRAILKMLRETRNKATFFVLGYVAKKHPGLVKEIKMDGHETASHGYWHRRINDQTKEEFENDILKSIKVIENAAGQKIKGYRAPQFTISYETSYALSLLKKHGLKYDSSIFPAKTPLYGVASAPMQFYRPSS